MDADSLAQIQLIVTTATDGLRQELRQEVRTAASSLREEMADTKRHTGVLIEGLRHELQLVTEGVQLHLERRHAEEHDYLDHQFQETRALIQLSYGQLHERVERLEQRVRAIEQHLGLSA